MVALLVLYDKPNRDHVLKWSVDVADVPTAVRVVGQLYRRHKRTDCPTCPVTHFTVSTRQGRHDLWALAASGVIDDVQATGATA